MHNFQINFASENITLSFLFSISNKAFFFGSRLTTPPPPEKSDLQLKDKRILQARPRQIQQPGQLIL